MLREYNIAGFGGQGILYLGQVLAYAGLLSGKQTTWIPSYGPEMRGGTANCMVVISDDKVRSPLVYNPNVALIFNKPSLEKFGADIMPNGKALLLSDLIDGELDRDDIEIFKIPAKTIAEEMGSAMSANMVMLGALLTIDPVFDYSQIEAAVKKVTPSHRQHLIEINLNAVKKGIEYAEQMINGGYKEQEG